MKNFIPRTILFILITTLLTSTLLGAENTKKLQEVKTVSPKFSKKVSTNFYPADIDGTGGQIFYPSDVDGSKGPVFRTVY